jgi:hypothetical protein
MEKITQNAENVKGFKKLVKETGWGLIPLHGKAPFENNWQKWCEEKRPFIIADYRNGNNAGIPCGPANGIIIFDEDHENKARKWLKAKGHTLPETRTHRTGSGLLHHIYEYPSDNGHQYGNASVADPDGEVDPETGKVIRIFDVKGLGGQVVAPGSIHPDTGEPYTVNQDIPIAPAPVWILDLTRRDETNEVPEESEEDGDIGSLTIPFLTKRAIREPCPEGNRSETIASVLTTLIMARLNDNQIIRIFEDNPQGIGAKYFEKRNGRKKWLRAEIERSRDFRNPGIDLNKKHAVIMVGGKCCVLNQTVDPVFNRPDITFSSKADFLNVYANRKIRNPNAPTRQISVGKLWWESPDRRQYKGIIFEPERDYPGFYNLWRGFAVKAKEGVWSLMERLIREAIASGNDARYRYILAWMARIVQDPGGKRPGVAFAMRGRQGIGKGVFSNSFGSLFGQHYLQVAQSSQVTGKFNSHLKDCVLLFCDESFWAGDKQAEGVIKNLVTEPTITCEPKGKDLFTVKNNVNIIIASNSDWVVPAGLDERRFFTVDVDNCFKGDYDFFKKLTAQMDNGGREAMFHDLQTMDISGIDLREFERTDALLEQIIESMTLIQKWWFSQLRRGAIMLDSLENWAGPKNDFWPKTASNEQLYDNFEIFARKQRGFIPVQEVFGRQLNKLMPEPVEYIRQAFVEGGPRKNGRIIPPLDDCRKVFEELLQMEVDWDREKEEFIEF